MSVKSRRRQALTVGPVAALAIVLAGCGDSSAAEEAVPMATFSAGR